MTALFNFESLLRVVLLLICTCTYIHAQTPSLLDRNKNGYVSLAIACRVTTRCPRLRGLFWKFARMGERLSPYVAISCVVMAFKTLLY